MCKTSMTKADHSAQTKEERIYFKLVHSALYQTYKRAFQDATGMPLALIPADADLEAAESEKFEGSRFCEAVNEGSTQCSACHVAGACLRAKSLEHAATDICFAGMRESMIPVRSANQVIAFLSTGRVFAEAQDEASFRRVATELKHTGFDPKRSDGLRSAWLETRVVGAEKYHGTVTLLAAFALQLSDLLNRLIIEEENAEPELITRAKQYVCSNLDSKVHLVDVARKVGVSTFYFCKVFKAATGMTLTEYVNRRRVEWAKRKLLNPQARVTEVAYDVGYQSLSQFNRSFQKYVGMSPTQYREEQCSERVSATSLAA